MRYSLRNRFFLIKKDFFSSLREHKSGVIGGVIVLILGVALGIYIGSDVGEKDSPFGLFASLFCLEFTPFSFLVPDLLRFLLFSVLSALAMVLPFHALFPAIALFFFGKYFGEVACVCFLSDPIVPAVLSILLLYVPLLCIGSVMLISITVRARASRIVSGVSPCRITLKRDLLYVLLLVFAYFIVLFVLYVIFCGILYLIMIAL